VEEVVEEAMIMLDPMEVVAVVVDHLRMEAVLAMEDQVETVEDLVITPEAETGLPKVVVAVVVLEAMIVSSWKTVSSFQACPST